MQACTGIIEVLSSPVSSGFRSRRCKPQSLTVHELRFLPLSYTVVEGFKVTKWFFGVFAFQKKSLNSRLEADNQKRTQLESEVKLNAQEIAALRTTEKQLAKVCLSLYRRS